MTSYMMALGKSLGIVFRIGVLRRQDRVTLLSIGLLFTPLHDTIATALQTGAARLGVSIDTVPIMPLAAIVYLLAVLSNVTALQRLHLLFVRADSTGGATNGEHEPEMSLRDKQLSLLEREIGIRDG